MVCRVKVSILSEQVAGNIGDDWAYTLDASAFNPALQSHGRISVDEHQLAPGPPQPVPAAGAVELRAGPCASAAVIKLQLRAREVDWLIDDTHPDQVGQLQVTIECPGPTGPPSVVETEISVGIRERPGFLGGTATFTLKIRLEASCR